MNLTEQQLSALILGAVDRDEKEGYTYFYRFTKKQRDYYASTKFASKEDASSGIVLECVTDATELKFDYRVVCGSSQKQYYFDLYSDGKMISHAGERDVTFPRLGTFRQPLPAGKKHLQLVFPALAGAGVKDVTFAHAAYAEPVKKEKTIVAYGDSITQGYISYFPSVTYTRLLAQALNAELFDLGIGGEVFEPRMTDENYPVKGDVVTVAYGTNDWSHRPAEEIREAAPAFLDRIAAIHAGAKIFVITPIWRKQDGVEERPFGALNDMRRYLTEEAEKRGMIPVDGTRLVPRYPEFFAPDLLHPNELGFYEYARNLETELKKHL